MGRTVLAFAKTGFAGKETTSQRGGANRDLPLGGAVDDSEDELFSERVINQHQGELHEGDSSQMR